MGVPFRIELTQLDEETVGDTVGFYRRIRISNDVDSKKLWSILVHEWVHAVLHVNGVANTLDEDIEEIIAQSMEHAIEELLRQVGPPLLQSYQD